MEPDPKTEETIPGNTSPAREESKANSEENAQEEVLDTKTDVAVEDQLVEDKDIPIDPEAPIGDEEPTTTTDKELNEQTKSEEDDKDIPVDPKLEKEEESTKENSESPAESDKGIDQVV